MSHLHDWATVVGKLHNDIDFALAQITFQQAQKPQLANQGLVDASGLNQEVDIAASLVVIDARAK